MTTKQRCKQCGRLANVRHGSPAWACYECKGLIQDCCSCGASEHNQPEHHYSCDCWRPSGLLPDSVCRMLEE